MERFHRSVSNWSLVTVIGGLLLVVVCCRRRYVGCPTGVVDRLRTNNVAKLMREWWWMIQWVRGAVIGRDGVSVLMAEAIAWGSSRRAWRHIGFRIAGSGRIKWNVIRRRLQWGSAHAISSKVSILPILLVAFSFLGAYLKAFHSGSWHRWCLDRVVFRVKDFPQSG